MASQIQLLFCSAGKKTPLSKDSPNAEALIFLPLWLSNFQLKVQFVLA